MKNSPVLSQTDRRNFLKVATASSLPVFASSSRAFANTEKNDRPNIGWIGVGNMGYWDARGHARLGDIVAVCDVDSDYVDKAAEDKDLGKGKADKYGDYRELLERQDIDVVGISTTDHWHVKMAIEALQAGKHVFCQKPLTLTIGQSQLIRKACKKYDKQVFGVGTQQRADKDRFLRAANMVRKGLLGYIIKITIGIDGGTVGGPFSVAEAPKTLDWDRWLGPAPKVAYRTERCHKSFRWWYEYSGGKFTDWGAHHVDIASLALGKHLPGQGPISIDGTDAKHPVVFKDGYPTVDDSYNTSHDFLVKCLYDDGLEMDITSRADNGILFEGTKGRMFVNRGKISGKPIEQRWDKDHWSPDDVRDFYKGKPFEGHKDNFYRCIREGGEPVSDVSSHTQMLNTCHLAVIAARLGQVIEWDPKSETIVDNELASRFINRPERGGYECPEI